MTRLTRRTLLGLAALGAAGCSTVIDELTEPELPDDLHPPGGADRNPTAHLLNRATYGPRPGQIEAVERDGAEAWIDCQLDCDSINDNNLAWRLRRYDTLNMKPRDLLSFQGGDDKHYVRDELAVMTIMRAVFSKRALYEVLVGFWTDHLSMYHLKGDVSLLKTVDDRDVIRPHALGNFGDLLRASAHSPAMLVYLDNVRNEKSHPNENYAREIMELHTLGVDGGYTEQDIKEVARCLTGWSVNRRGEFEFRAGWHDDGNKTVLGHTIPAGGGQSDGERVLDILIEHPSTARYVSGKLVRRFVADDPPPAIVDDCATTWQATGGNIAAMVRTILTHSLFQTAPPRLKRPYELVISLLRATGADYNGDAGLVDVLTRLGQRPFAWPTPDGYADTAEQWSGNMLHRWNLGIDALDGKLPGVEIDLDALAAAGDLENNAGIWITYFGRLFLKRDLNEKDAAALRSFARDDTLVSKAQLRRMVGLLAASPDFQWR